jgi:general secretion pathway protein E
MRQDPDIIMVGEIRDLETAEMAIQAALTGHLVLSTLHTNDAPSAITRLLDLGVPSYLLNATVLGVMAQRLVRTLCPHCKQWAVWNAAIPAIWAASACTKCSP